MNNTFGQRFRMTVFGASHAPCVGVTVEGVPAGTVFDLPALQTFLSRRAPGGPESSARQEKDIVEFTAGLVSGTATGDAITGIIRNTDVRSADYEKLRTVPRPGHADWAAMARFGDRRDYRGGGMFSGRMTAPICIAGGLALQMLEQRGIRVSARAVSVAGFTAETEMHDAVRHAKAEGDSVGGIIECTVTGLPAGVGEPMFGGMENRIAQAVFAIPGVKGIEFGAGFAAAGMRGSENNDPFYFDEVGAVKTRTNHHGGILGGLTSGMPIVFRTAVKPTPSIAKAQESVDIETGASVALSVTGRHDPCIVFRAVPCVEAAAAAAILDALLEWEG